MTMMKRIAMIDEMTYQNSSERNMDIERVTECMLQFIAQDPCTPYHFIIGTDSHTTLGATHFVTGIVLHRIGKGAWACFRQFTLPRQLNSLKEKLMLETAFSQRVAAHFAEESLSAMEELLSSHLYQGAMLEAFIDIDAGTDPLRNRTSLYIEEMVNRVYSMGGYAPRVKPEAVVASAYANRYSKLPLRQVV